MNTTLLKEIDELIKKKDYKEGLKMLENTDADGLALVDKAYYYYLLGEAYCMTGSGEAGKYLEKAHEMYIVFVKMGIVEPSVILQHFRCMISLGIWNYKSGYFDLAEKLFNSASVDILKYDHEFEEPDRMLARQVQVKALTTGKVRLLDKTRRFKESMYIQERAEIIRNKLDLSGFKESMLERYIVTRERFEHLVNSGRFEEAYIQIEELIGCGRDLLVENFKLYCEEAGKAFISTAGLYMKFENVNAANFHATNAVTVLEDLCYEPYHCEYAEPVLASAYICLAETYMTGGISADNYQKAEMFLLKGYELAKKLFNSNSLLHMELFAEINNLLAELYYINRPNGEAAHKSVKYCMEAIRLFREMYVGRDESAYWNQYSASLFLMSSIYAEINKKLADKVASEARKILKKHLFPGNIR